MELVVNWTGLSLISWYYKKVESSLLVTVMENHMKKTQRKLRW